MAFKEGKTLSEFNVKNAKFAVKKEDETYDVPFMLTYADALAYDPQISLSPVYGDGEQQKQLVNDKGYTGTFTTTAHDEELETALGFKSVNADGNKIDINVTNMVRGALYAEVMADKGSKTIVGKKWILGVEIGKASNSYAQNTDNPNPSTWAYPLTIYGDKMLESGVGTEIYVDENGFNKMVYVVNAIPTDSNYATFGNSVPVQKIKPVI